MFERTIFNHHSLSNICYYLVHVCVAFGGPQVPYDTCRQSGMMLGISRLMISLKLIVGRKIFRDFQILEHHFKGFNDFDLEATDGGYLTYSEVSF